MAQGSASCRASLPATIIPVQKYTHYQRIWTAASLAGVGREPSASERRGVFSQLHSQRSKSELGFLARSLNLFAGLGPVTCAGAQCKVTLKVVAILPVKHTGAQASATDLGAL